MAACVSFHSSSTWLYRLPSSNIALLRLLNLTWRGGAERSEAAGLRKISHISVGVALESRGGIPETKMSKSKVDFEKGLHQPGQEQWDG